MPPARRRYRPWLPAARVCRASRSWDWCPFGGSVIAGRSARVQWLASLAAWFLTSRLSASGTTLTNHGADQLRAAFPIRKRRALVGPAVLLVAVVSVGGTGSWEQGGRGWRGGRWRGRRSPRRWWPRRPSRRGGAGRGPGRPRPAGRAGGGAGVLGCCWVGGGGQGRGGGGEGGGGAWGCGGGAGVGKWRNPFSGSPPLRRALIIAVLLALASEEANPSLTRCTNPCACVLPAPVWPLMKPNSRSRAEPRKSSPPLNDALFSACT